MPRSESWPRTVLLLLLAVAAAAGVAAYAQTNAKSVAAAPKAVRTTVSTASLSSTGTVHPQADPTYYVAIGDSYAAGYQPIAQGVGRMTRNGYVYQTVAAAAAKGYHLTLANFGCSGATTASALTQRGCPAGAGGPGGQKYTTSQVDAAATFIRAHRGHIGLVTVTLGGNDLTGCNRRHEDLTTCLPAAVVTIRASITTLLLKLRAAAGGALPIVGTTYPDFLLGNAVRPEASARGLAPASVPFFHDELNPILASTYKAAGAQFVDATQAFGGYGSLTRTVSLAPYGEIPQPVAKICTLTYYCEYQDIHPRTPGYAIMARLVTAKLPQR